MTRRVGARLGCLLAWVVAALCYVNNYFETRVDRQLLAQVAAGLVVGAAGTGPAPVDRGSDPSSYRDTAALARRNGAADGKQDDDEVDPNSMPEAVEVATVPPRPRLTQHPTRPGPEPKQHQPEPAATDATGAGKATTAATSVAPASTTQQQGSALITKSTKSAEELRRQQKEIGDLIGKRPRPPRPAVTWSHPSPGWKAAIGVLVKYERRVRKMQEKIKSMLHTISVQPWAKQYPILLFMDSADPVTHVPAKHMEAIASCVDAQNLEIVWIDVSAVMFEARGQFMEVYYWTKGENGGSTTTDKDWGYRAMCQFWSNLVYSIPEVAGLDALMRLDDDSWLASATAPDPLLAFKESGAAYSYQMAYQNKPDRHMSTNLLRHLAEFVGGRAVLRDRLQRLQADRGKRSNEGNGNDGCPNVRLPGVDDNYVPQVIYNNLFITRPALWTTHDGVARSFFEFVSAREGFRKDGIGDAEFHTVVVCILAQAEWPASEWPASEEPALPGGASERGHGSGVWPVAVLPVGFPYRHGASMPDPDRAGMQMTIPGCDYWNAYIPSNGCNKTPAC